jgi:hypothetical protein
MRKSLLLSTCVAAALAAPAHAESWFLVGEGDDDLFFADADSLVRTGNYLQVDIIDSMKDPLSSNGTDVYYLRGPTNYDCSAKQYQNVSQKALNLAHAYVADVNVDTAWQPVGAGTYAEVLFQFACEGSQRTEPMSDPFGYAEDYWYYYYSDDETAPS